METFYVHGAAIDVNLRLHLFEFRHVIPLRSSNETFSNSIGVFLPLLFFLGSDPS